MAKQTEEGKVHLAILQQYLKFELVICSRFLSIWGLNFLKVQRELTHQFLFGSTGFEVHFFLENCVWVKNRFAII